MDKKEVKQILQNKLNISILEDKDLFMIPANSICWEIKNLIKTQQPDVKFIPVFEVDKNQINQNKLYTNTISTSISIKDKYQVKKVILSTNASAKNENEFTFGTYKINVLEILNNNNLPYLEMVHQGCLNAIVKNAEEKLAKIQAGFEKRNLLIKKLEILQNEKLREKEIKKIKFEIAMIDSLNDPDEIQFQDDII